jgi:hypothetical protein
MPRLVSAVLLVLMLVTLGLSETLQSPEAATHLAEQAMLRGARKICSRWLRASNRKQMGRVHGGVLIITRVSGETREDGAPMDVFVLYAQGDMAVT